MEYRKVIKFGNSSFVVSLPNTWVKKNNIKKGDSVFFEENNYNELIFRTSNNPKKYKKRILINATNKELIEIEREVTANYIKGFNTIEVLDENMYSRSKTIRNILQNLIGLEILEQTQKRLIAKDLSDIDSIPILGLVKRIDIIIRSMMLDSFNLLTSNKKEKDEKFLSIYDRDNDINRLVFLAFRVLRFLLDNPSFAAKKNITNQKIFSYFIIFENLEKLADSVKRRSRLIISADHNQEYNKELMSLLKNLEDYYLDCMKAFINNDAKLALQIGSQKDKFIKTHKNLLEKYNDVNTALIYELLNSTLVYIRNIARSIYA